MIRIDPRHTIQNGPLPDRWSPPPKQTSPILPLDQATLVRGKPSTLRLLDLKKIQDFLELSPPWKKNTVRLKGDPADWDLANLEDTRSRIQKMLLALRERKLEGRPEYSDFVALEGELSRLIQDRKKDPFTAFDAFMKLLLHPTAFEARLNKKTREGWSFLARKRHESAKRTFRRVLFFRPDDAAALGGMGRCLFEEGDFKGAKSLLERALRFDPKDGKASLLLGKALHRLGDKEAAKKAFTGALDRNPDHAEPYAWLGILAYEEENHRGALTFLQQAISLDPLDSAARFYLAQISLQHNDPLRASFQLDVVKKLEPEVAIPALNPSRALPLSSEEGCYEPYRWAMPV